MIMITSSAQKSNHVNPWTCSLAHLTPQFDAGTNIPKATPLSALCYLLYGLLEMSVFLVSPCRVIIPLGGWRDTLRTWRIPLAFFDPILSHRLPPMTYLCRSYHSSLLWLPGLGPSSVAL